MRASLGGTKESPHPGPVEGRTSAVRVSPARPPPSESVRIAADDGAQVRPLPVHEAVHAALELCDPDAAREVVARERDAELVALDMPRAHVAVVGVVALPPADRPVGIVVFGEL